jgi:polyhydroxyalkanoate synthesis regulator protein
MHERPDATTVIKRYGAARLYDTTAGRYVDFADIAALLQDGRRVKVRDAASGEDTTEAVLARALALAGR